MLLPKSPVRSSFNRLQYSQHSKLCLQSGPGQRKAHWPQPAFWLSLSGPYEVNGKLGNTILQNTIENEPRMGIGIGIFPPDLAVKINNKNVTHC